MPDGSCFNYDHETKLCKIYETRPDVCRVDALRPSNMRANEWYDLVEDQCDDAHQLVYGTKRERMKVEDFKGTLEGMTLILATPSYGPVDPACQKDLRVAMMVCSKYGVRWIGDASTDRMGFAGARNTSAQTILEPGMEDATGIMWVDSDIRQGPRDMASLLLSAKEYKAEFVTGVYHQRAPTHNPVFYHFNPSKKLFQPFEDYPENVFAPIEGCGFGFVYTSRSLIESIAKHKDFNSKKGWFPDERDSGGFGEDMSFCKQAMQCGIQLYVNTAIQLGHTGDPRVVYREDYLRERAINKAAINAVGPKEEDKWGIK
jgi:hypothetical protein